MSLVRYNPWGLFNELHRDINRVFDNRQSQLSNEGETGLTQWAPAVDIHEDAEGFVIRADIPGVDPDKIELTAANGVLSLRGERREEKDSKEKNVHRVERSYGLFFRQFSLPPYADTEHVGAKCNNGVLEIRVPRKSGDAPKRINVSR